MPIRRPGGNVKEQSRLRREFFQYKVLPPWWVPLDFKDTEIIQAVANANGLDLSATNRIEVDISTYVNPDTKNKIVGKLGKIAVYKYYRFSPEKIFSKKNRGYFDFYESGKNITVKTSSFLRSEVLLLGRNDVENERGTDIFVGVNLDFDEENIYQTIAYITGWITKQGFREKCYYAEDIRGDLMFVPMAALSTSKTLAMYLKMAGRS